MKCSKQGLDYLTKSCHGVTNIRGSPILFSWCMNGHFRFTQSINEDLFFLWFVILYFPVLRKVIFYFFVIHEICIYLCMIYEPTTFAGIIFHFFDIGCLFNVLADGDLELTTATVKQKGLESRIMNESPDTNLHFCRFCTQVGRKYCFTCLTLEPPSPQYNVENQYLQFLLLFNILLGRKGKSNTLLRKAVLFFKLQ